MCFSNHRTARGAESGVVERTSPTPTHDEKPCLGGELFKNGNRGAVELDLTDRDARVERGPTRQLPRQRRRVLGECPDATSRRSSASGGAACTTTSSVFAASASLNAMARALSL